MGLDIQRAAGEVEKIVGHEVGSTTDKYENTVRDYHASACVPSRNRSWGPSQQIILSNPIINYPSNMVIIKVHSLSKNTTWQTSFSCACRMAAILLIICIFLLISMFWYSSFLSFISMSSTLHISSSTSFYRYPSPTPFSTFIMYVVISWFSALSAPSSPSLPYPYSEFAHSRLSLSSSSSSPFRSGSLLLLFPSLPLHILSSIKNKVQPSRLLLSSNLSFFPPALAFLKLVKLFFLLGCNGGNSLSKGRPSSSTQMMNQSAGRMGGMLDWPFGTVRNEQYFYLSLISAQDWGFAFMCCLETRFPHWLSILMKACWGIQGRNRMSKSSSLCSYQTDVLIKQAISSFAEVNFTPDYFWSSYRHTLKFMCPQKISQICRYFCISSINLSNLLSLFPLLDPLDS